MEEGDIQNMSLPAKISTIHPCEIWRKFGNFSHVRLLMSTTTYITATHFNKQ